MITCNGILGLSLLLGAWRSGLTVFNAEGTGAALATVATLATLSLALPTFTTARPGPEFSPAQLTFAATASLALYGMFVLNQTVRHRDFFLPLAPDRSVLPPDEHASPPTTGTALTSLGFLLVALVAVVGLAKVESPIIEDAVGSLGYPQSFVGVVIALLVLLPETLAAANAARRRRTQNSPNLALGSAMASIGLTRRRHHLARWAAAARPRVNAAGAARPDHRGRGPHRRSWPGDPPAGRGPPCAARRLPLPRCKPLSLTASPPVATRSQRDRRSYLAEGTRNIRVDDRGVP